MSQKPDLIERLTGWFTDWNGARMVPGEPPRDGIHCDILMEAATALAEKDARIAELEAAVVVQRESKEYAQRCCVTAESALTASRAECEGLRAAIARPEGLSAWAGWDRDRYPWGETKHKDAVLEALFRGPWSAEDAVTLIRFIDRTWGGAALSQKETGNAA